MLTIAIYGCLSLDATIYLRRDVYAVNNNVQRYVWVHDWIKAAADAFAKDSREMNWNEIFYSQRPSHT